MKSDIKNSIERFLAQKTIAIVGCSWEADDSALHIFSKLKKLGYTLIPISLTKDNIDSVPCFKSLLEAPDNIDAVMVTGNSALSLEVVECCIKRHISLVWLHSALGTSPRHWMRNMEYQISSVGPEALELAKKNGITVIPGGCPMMFRDPIDLPHKIIQKILNLMGCFEDRQSVGASKQNKN